MPRDDRNPSHHRKKAVVESSKRRDREADEAGLKARRKVKKLSRRREEGESAGRTSEKKGVKTVKRRRDPNALPLEDGEDAALAAEMAAMVAGFVGGLHGKARHSFLQHQKAAQGLARPPKETAADKAEMAEDASSDSDLDAAVAEDDAEEARCQKERRRRDHDEPAGRKARTTALPSKTGGKSSKSATGKDGRKVASDSAKSKRPTTQPKKHGGGRLFGPGAGDDSSDSD